MAATGSSERELLRESTRGFLNRHAPLAAVRAELERPRTLDRDAWRRAAQMGWIATFVPSEDGGLADLAVVAEELGRGLYPGPFLGCALAAAVHPELDG